MAHDEESLWRLLGEVREMPFGPGQIAAVEEVVAHADAAGLPELAFAARMQATTAYTYGGEPAKAFVTFSWCLSEFDRGPGYHDENDSHLILWHFKYMVSALTRFPELPLDRTFAVLTDMERRYRDGGHSLYAVYSLRHLVARHLGDAEAAEYWYQRWSQAQRDQLADCAGCDPGRRVEYLASLGRDEEAVRLAEPVLAGRLTCKEQPQGMLTALLRPYLRTGRLAEAADAHRRAYRVHRQYLADLADIADHVEFCAETGNEARGLAILERHLDWLDRAPSPYAAMEFAAASARVLRRLTETGRGGEPVGPSASIVVSELAERMAATATSLAERFDTRNGTSYQSERIAARLAAEPLIDYLPLSVTARRPTAGAGGGAGGGAGAESAALPAPPPPRPVTAADAGVPPTAGPDDLLGLAEEHARQGRMAEAIVVWLALDERFGHLDLPVLATGRRADGQGHQHAEAGDLPAAEAEWVRAAELFAKAGDEIRRQAVLGKVGLVRCMAGRPEDSVELIEASAAYLLAHADPARQVGALSRLAMLRMVQERFEDALDALDRAIELAGDRVGFQAELAVRRAECLAMFGRTEELREQVAAARERARGVAPGAFAGACLLHGTVLMEDEAYPDALTAFDEAFVAADQAQVRLNARLGRARALRALDRPAEAVDELIEVVAGCAELGAEEGAAFGRVELAHAYRHAGRLSEAIEAAEEALTRLDRLGAQDDADRCRHLLATLYRDLSEPEPALALFDTLAANLDGFDNLPARAHAYEEAGEILYRLDRDGEAAARYGAAATAYRQAGAVIDEVRLHRKRALALRWADRSDEAVESLAEADRRIADLTADPAESPQVVWELAMIGYEGARLLAGVGRMTEALIRIEGVSDRFRSIDAYSEGVLAELLHGELLLRAERPAEAEPVLRAALAGLPRDADPVQHAAWLLAGALSAQGRDAEAGAVRAEYGVEDD
jgi:tetratricopeptide (TPR) repeat protein